MEVTRNGTPIVFSVLAKISFDLGILPVDEYAKKLINQGMILGESAFIYRKTGTDTYLSKNLIGKHKVEPIRVDVNLVNTSYELDLEAIRSWQPQFKNAHFELEAGKYIVGTEVEKMSKSKYNVVNPDAICDRYGADTLRMYEMFWDLWNKPNLGTWLVSLASIRF